MEKRTVPYGLIFGVIAMAWILLLAKPWQDEPVGAVVPYSLFKQWTKDGKVSRVTLEGQKAAIILTERIESEVGGALTSTDRAVTYIPPLPDNQLIQLLEDNDVIFSSLPDTSGTRSVFLSFLPWLALIGFYIWFQTRMYRNIAGGLGAGGAKDFLAGSTKREEKSGRRVTFDDVAGQDAAKDEVAELIAFLRNPEMYRSLGAEPPRGILLLGPPGTGKTLLARALAGEADVPFFSISASEFIELYVGVGASRVRSMFDEAKKRAPSIIFIDELDSIGRVRGTGLGGGHDEREQTLNQILSEMDGFSAHEAVIVVAATNRPDILDPALLRPGRFDRHVTLDLPDKEARLAILKVHTRKVPMGADADLAAIAAGTPGFSGADLKNLVNEAAMAAAREGRKSVSMNNLDQMRDKVIMGTVRTLAIQPGEHRRLAVHESGHTAVAYHLPNADPIYKVTIIPRGRALGSTHMLPEEERHTLPEPYLKDRLAVMLAGRMAEKLFLGSVSSGADDDIREATKLARAMVARWGMSEEIGPVDFRQSDDHPFLGREITQARYFSEGTAHLVDRAVQDLLNDASKRAEAVLVQHDAPVRAMIDALEARETLDKQEIATFLGTSDKTASAPSNEATSLMQAGVLSS